MPYLRVVEHPCAICGGPNLRPYAVCERMECREAWQRKTVAERKRERYAFYVQQGRCGDCGLKIASNEVARDTGTHPIARCAACRAVQRKLKKRQRDKARQRARAERLLEQQIQIDVNRQKAQKERIRLGLPISRSINPALPKSPPSIVDL